MEVHIERSFDDLPKSLLSQLARGGSNPFMSSHFLGALESSQCVSPQQGWQPQHLWIESDGQPNFYMPLYLKSHSWGEFVFDQSWAQAYRRVGLNYYPKLVTAIPFTPSLGPRWWCALPAQEDACLALALGKIEQLSNQLHASSWHLLFSKTALKIDGPSLLARRDTQFHWMNRDYESFDQFLELLKSRKRKSIRREREKVEEQGVTLTRKLGSALDSEDWQQFYHCYCNTYRERGMEPYLNLSFFKQVGQTLSEQIMMVQAHRQGQNIANAIFFFDDDVLYGRHWGALEKVDCLHFEACFYQGIEFCIEKGLQRFDPGTQGEHKLMRGFEPVTTDSFHWIHHHGFRDAIAEYLQTESSQMERYHQTATEYLPFKNDS